MTAAVLATRPELRTCRLCGGQVTLARVWYLEDRPKRRAPTWMPLDVPLENGDGNVALHRSSAGQLRARVLRKGEEPMATEVRAMPHFATCRPPERPRLPENVIPLRARRPRGRR